MQPTVIYHKSDFDGIFCREIARKFLPDANLIGWEYGEPCPAVPEASQLYILDLSVPELMNRPGLIWIDHHKSAIDKYPASIAGYRIDGVAACRLAWQWFIYSALLDHDGHELPSKEHFVERRVSEPFAVRLAGEYDIWDKRDPNAELFQHGLRSQALEAEHWDLLLQCEAVKAEADEFVCELLNNGKVLQFARRQESASTINAFGFTIQLEGLTLLACNTPKVNSLFFEAGLKPEHDGCFAFHWTGQHWRCSLYGAPGKPNVDLSQIAIKFGGGGHKQACGFTCEQLLFPLV